MERLGNSSQSLDVPVPRCETHLGSSTLNIGSRTPELTLAENLTIR